MPCAVSLALAIARGGFRLPPNDNPEGFVFGAELAARRGVKCIMALEVVPIVPRGLGGVTYRYGGS